jgi:hypothetical protein
MGVGGFFLKPSEPLSLIKTYRMSLISAGSISVDNTFKSFFYLYIFGAMDIYRHRLNMELDLQSIFGLLYTAVLIG